MKIFKLLIAVIVICSINITGVYSQKVKTAGSCKMFLDEKIVTEVSLADAVKWCKLAPPTVQCDDGKIYKLETFNVGYLSLKPFESKDFGIGEGGFPIMALKTIENGKVGDTIILKDVTYTNPAGEKATLPIISIKISK